jgi:hypothetical protein
LLQNWDTPPVDDALELLSGEFTNEVVRTYAVGLLRRATDEVRAMAIVSVLWSLSQVIRVLIPSLNDVKHASPACGLAGKLFARLL